VITTVEFVYHLFCAGMLIAALHIADVRPWAERMALIDWPILIGVSVWFVGGYLPTRRGWLCRPLRLVHVEATYVLILP
jgi:hypothetical protein